MVIVSHNLHSPPWRIVWSPTNYQMLSTHHQAPRLIAVTNLSIAAMLEATITVRHSKPPLGACCCSRTIHLILALLAAAAHHAPAADGPIHCWQHILTRVHSVL
jgi:hypothetical protein